jgi:hypothetical protein
MEIPQNPRPWDPLPDEKPQWFDRFDKYFRPFWPEISVLGAYLRFLEDKQREVAGQVGKKPKSAPHTWMAAADRWRWKERAQAFADTLFMDRRQVEDEERRKMIERHRDIARKMNEAALKRLEQFIKDPESLDATEVRLYLVAAINIERTAYGMPTDMVGLLNLSDDELIRRYQDVVTRLARAGGSGGTGEGAGDQAPAAGDADNP